ncbi:MAG: hypothetical protein ACYS47_04530 [Planctomycetota bacterium]|jgi:hypothetical protein
MTAESAEQQEEKGTTGGKDGALPTDFFVGLTLLCVAFFVFVLSAAGVLGEGGEAKGGHGAEPEGKHEAKEADAEKKAPGKTDHAEKEAGEKAAAPEEGPEEEALETAGGEPSRVALRKGAEPIDPAKTKVVLLPCDVKAAYELGLSVEEVSDVLSEGCAKSFGEMGVPLDKIKARLSEGEFEGLSRHLATGAYRALRWSDSFDLAADRFMAESKGVPARVQAAVDLAEREGVVDFEARYVFALTIVGMGPGEGNQKRVRVAACLYDLKVKRVHSCVYYPEVLPAEKLPIQQRFASIPGEAFERLMEKAAKGK